MASVQFTDVQARSTEFLDLTSLTLDEFQHLVPPFEAAFHGRNRVIMHRLEDTHELQDATARIAQFSRRSQCSDAR